MEKPVPLELTILYTIHGLKITMMTHDSRMWIEKEASTFGRLTFRSTFEASLEVYDSYDVADVMNYLRSYGVQYE